MTEKIKRKDIELMSPAGSFESLHAAIQGGADAVYFGISNLNMRAKSSLNFTNENLSEIVDICKTNNVNSYLTVNTIIYDKDVEEMQRIVDLAVNKGVTAVIASDMAVLNYAKKAGAEIHASTQLNISNSEAIKFFSQYCDVMVLARELNLEQVNHIHRKIIEEKITGPNGNLVKLEMFCHGALCMAVSGKCYLSLHEKQYAANRGQCLQTCRKSYIVTEKESGNELEIDNEYIMSPKDLKTIHFLNKIIDVGVRVLKIEGRARSPEYVKTVTQCYNEAINSIIDGSYNQSLIEEWDKRLSSVFNRGFWDGYYLGQRLGEWSSKYGSEASKKKRYIAKCTNFFSNLNVAEFLVETGDLKIGNNILIIGSTTGVVEHTISEMHLDNGPVDFVKKGDKFSIKTNELIRRGDRLYILEENEKSKFI